LACGYSGSLIDKGKGVKVTLAIGHVRYINILTWRSGQTSIFGGAFVMYKPPLGDTGNSTNLQFCPVNLGAMLQFWYIESSR